MQKDFPKTAPTKDKPARFIPPLIGLVSFIAFLPVLRGKFVDIDDRLNFVTNLHYRGLGWTQIKWMFSGAASYGHYIPLTWLTLGLDYVVWGMDPRGYHLTNLLLHSFNAVIFYFVSRRLLAAATPRSADPSPRALELSAAFSACVFALHPLRVESVAWITERRDVLSGLFYLLTGLCHLKYCADARLESRRRWLLSGYAFFGFSLLSKISGITLPFILIALDVYPLRRLSGDPKRWLAPEFRRVWIEKIPYLLMLPPAAAAAFVAEKQFGTMRSLHEVGFAGRIALSGFAAAFGIWKTLVPSRLVPLYELSLPFDPFAPVFMLSGALVVAVSVLFFGLRRRFPAGLTAWSAYLLALAPMMGIVAMGKWMATDRSTYLACLAWAVLLGAGLRALLRRTRAWSVAAAGVLIVSAALTWRQASVWHDPETLWRHVLNVRPETTQAYNNMGLLLFEKGDVDEAIRLYEQGLRSQPDYFEIQNNLGIALAGQGKTNEAIRHYELALKARPDLAEASNNLGMALAGQGKTDEAIRHYELALQARPDYPEVHDHLGRVLAAQGKTDEAIKHYVMALQARPNYAEAHLDLGDALAGQGKTDEATRHFELALGARPDYPEAHNSLGVSLARQGQMSEAILHFELALSARPGYADAHNNLGLTLARQGRIDEATRHFKLALQAQPKSAEAHNNLGLAMAAQGRRNEAIRHFRQALQIDPGLANARANLEMALKRWGNEGPSR